MTLFVALFGVFRQIYSLMFKCKSRHGSFRNSIIISGGVSNAGCSDRVFMNRQHDDDERTLNDRSTSF